MDKKAAFGHRCMHFMGSTTVYHGTDGRTITPKLYQFPISRTSLSVQETLLCLPRVLSMSTTGKSVACFLMVLERVHQLVVDTVHITD